MADKAQTQEEWIAERRKREMTRTCVECGRIFDLLNEPDADEWYSGHDCEV
jgi:UDP-N-acetyl-D-mannosaminuronic acid transferase (WecB/TagA/CpsF family)